MLSICTLGYAIKWSYFAFAIFTTSTQYLSLWEASTWDLCSNIRFAVTMFTSYYLFLYRRPQCGSCIISIYVSTLQQTKSKKFPYGTKSLFDPWLTPVRAYHAFIWSKHFDFCHEKGMLHNDRIKDIKSQF